MSELVCKTLELLAETKGGFVSAVKNIFDTRTMATLKISDLSVGDWVQDNYGDYVKVAGIWQGCNFNYQVDILRDGRIGTIVPCNLHPIPITAEILEKNGWECVEVGDNGPSTPKQYYNRYEKWQVETTWGKRVLIFDRMTKRYRLKGMNDYGFAEVHKLQHALRLSDFYYYDINL